MPKIPDHRFEIPEAALGICVFAADKKTQPHRKGLEFICIEPEPAKRGKTPYIHAVATNGYHMIHLRWVPDPDKDTIPDGILLLHADECKKFLKNKRPPDTRYWITEERGDWAVMGDHGDRMVLGDTPEDYPEWRDIIPRRVKAEKNGEVVEFGMNLKWLEVYIKFSKKHLGIGGFRMSVPRDGLSPLLLTPVQVGNEYDEKNERVETEYILNDGVTEMEYVLMGCRLQ